MRGRACAWALVVAILPGTAQAANALRPRTPAVFGEVECLVRVDKRAEPAFHVDYTVPYDDVELTEEEVPDSRRHQFFAFARQRFDFALPTWITHADLERAEANGDVTRAYDDDDVLESSTAWPQETWVRITPDDDRLPITNARAAEGVAWDLTEVPPGTWMIAAYTWEPENNLWSHRLGVVKVVDSQVDPVGSPAAFVSFGERPSAGVGEMVALEGCVDAAKGSTLELAYGVVVGTDEPDWVVVSETETEVDHGSAALAAELEIPEAAANAAIKVRVVVTDPDGRSYAAFSPAMPVTAGAGSGAGEGETAGDSGAGADDEAGGSGGGCSISTRTPTPAEGSTWALVVILGAGGLCRATRRRSRARLRR